MLLFSACACKKAGGGDGSGPVPQNVVTEGDRHYQTGGLHKFDVTPRDLDFIVSGRTDYRIVVPDAEADTEGMYQLQKNIELATGATTDVVTESETMYSASAKLIVLNSRKLFDQARLAMPEDDIGQTGYYIKTKGNSVFIMANSHFGSTNGCLEFLKQTLGYEMYSSDTVVFREGDTFTLPNMEIIDKPDFEFHIQSNYVDSETATGMRFMESTDVFMPVNGLLWHNTFQYLPKNTYYESHREWYSELGDQFCYTAHGNEDSLEEMIDTLMIKLTEVVDAHPDIENVSVSMEDTSTWCTCPACAAEKEKYGVNSAAVVKFINRVAEKLDAYLAGQAEENGTEKRNVNVLFFAYRQLESPPVKEENGKFVPVDESVRCRDNVGVYIAPINAAYNKSFYDDANLTTANAIKGWGACSERLFFWLYETNFSHYLFPFNSYDTMADTYRFCKENNGVFMFSEGQYNQGNTTAFGKLKEYFNAKMLWDVNTDYNTLVDDFFANYFRDAAPAMRTYFDQLQVHLKYIEEMDPVTLNGGIFNNIAQAKFWPKKLLDQWSALIDEAYSAVEIYRNSDPELYASLCSHINLESIFIRYAQLTLYSGMFSSDVLQQMRLAFKEDVGALEIYRPSEGSSGFTSLFNSWGL